MPGLPLDLITESAERGHRTSQRVGDINGSKHALWPLRVLLGIVMASAALSAPVLGQTAAALLSEQPSQSTSASPQDTDLKRRADSQLKNGQDMLSTNPDGAGKPLEEALAIYKQLGLKPESVTCLRALIEMNRVAPKNPESAKFKQVSAELMELDHDPVLRVDRLQQATDENEMARSCYNQHFNTEALRHAEVAAHLLANANDAPALSERMFIERSLAVIYGMTGEAASSALHWHRLAQLARRTGNQVWTSVGLANSALLECQHGNLQEGIRQAFAAIEVADRYIKLAAGSTRAQAILEAQAARLFAFNSLAMAANYYGNHAQARTYYRKAQQASLQSIYPGRYTIFEASIADIDAATGNPAVAERRYRAAIHAAARDTDSEENIAVSVAYAQFLVGRRKYGEALPFIAKIRNYNHETHWNLDMADYYLLSGECSLGRRRWQQAMHDYDLVLASSVKFDIPEDRWRAHVGRGRALEGMGRLREALAEYSSAIQALETLYRRAAPTVHTPDASITRFQEPYQATFRLLWRRGARREAYEISERARARLLRQTLSDPDGDVSRGLPATEQQQEQTLRRSYSMARDRYMSLLQQPNVSTDEAQSAQANRDLAIDALDTFESHLHPELKMLRGQGRITRYAELSQLAQRSKTVILDYVMAGTGVYVYVANGQRVSAAALPITRETLERQIEQLNRHLRDWQNGQPTSREAEQLYTALIAPIAAQLKEAETICIIPDGKLWQLPFAALYDARSGGNGYLVERYALQVAPSVSAFAAFLQREKSAQRNRFANERQLAVFCNSAPGRSAAEFAVVRGALGRLKFAPEEAKAIRDVYAHGAKLFLNRDATPSQAVSALAQYRIVHFAAHGYCSIDQPLHSYILLAGERGANRDGYLEAHDLMNLQINARLVVFSACETARGNVVPGEGLIGLTWAAFVGGASSQVATLWQIDDRSTVTLMREFYRRLRQGDRPAQAMRQAQLALFHRPEYAHPFFWAPFLVLGSGTRP